VVVGADGAPFWMTSMTMSASSSVVDVWVVEPESAGSAWAAATTNGAQPTRPAIAAGTSDLRKLRPIFTPLRPAESFPAKLALASHRRRANRTNVQCPARYHTHSRKGPSAC
jgi:hypothetical protein